MAKQTKPSKVETQDVNWNKRLVVGKKFNVEYEITELTSEGGGMAVTAKPLNLPQGVSMGNLSFGTIPQD